MSNLDQKIEQAIDLLFYKEDMHLIDFVTLQKLAADVDIPELVQAYVKGYSHAKFASAEEAVKPIAHATVVAKTMSELYKEAGWMSMVLKPLKGLSKSFLAGKTLGKSILKKTVGKKGYSAVRNLYRSAVSKYDSLWGKYITPHVSKNFDNLKHVIPQATIAGTGFAMAGKGTYNLLFNHKKKQAPVVPTMPKPHAVIY